MTEFWLLNNSIWQRLRDEGSACRTVASLEFKIHATGNSVLEHRWAFVCIPNLLAACKPFSSSFVRLGELICRINSEHIIAFAGSAVLLFCGCYILKEHIADLSPALLCRLVALQMRRRWPFFVRARQSRGTFSHHEHLLKGSGGDGMM